MKLDDLKARRDSEILEFVRSSSAIMIGARIADLEALVGELGEALREVAACMLNGGDGQVGDFGWKISRLTKARPMIRATLAKLEKARG